MLKLAQSMYAISQSPDAEQCGKVSAELDRLEAELQALKPPPLCQAFHGLLLDSLKVQRAELLNKTEFIKVSESAANGAIDEETLKQASQKSLDLTRQHAEEISVLNKKIQTELQRF
jgi:hypothetical protein